MTPEQIAERQRAYFDREPEVVLADTLQAMPLLAGPEDFCKADNTLSIGSGYVLPMKKNAESGAYEGWKFTYKWPGCPGQPQSSTLVRHIPVDEEIAWLILGALCVAEDEGVSGIPDWTPLPKPTNPELNAAQERLLSSLYELYPHIVAEIGLARRGKLSG